MKSVSGREFARMIERRGWILIRVQVNHHIYGKFGNPARIALPIQGNASLKSGLLRHLAKLAEIPDEDLR